LGLRCDNRIEIHTDKKWHKNMKKIINVKGKEIVIFSQNAEEYISLTDIARYKNPNEPKDVVKNWLRSKSTIEFLGLWEKINNPNFKGVEFDSFLRQATSKGFMASRKLGRKSFC